MSEFKNIPGTSATVDNQWSFIKKGGGQVLLHAGHQYYKKKSLKNGVTVYECNQRRQNCRGLVNILLCLTIFMCGYCFYRVNRMRQNGEIAILLRPTKVVFSHKKEGEATEELRTVVAYQNPFTGDYCVHKSRAGPKGYVNNLQQPDSPDSGLSDEYEPLNLEPPGPQPNLPHVMQDKMPPGIVCMPQPDLTIKLQMSPNNDYNSVNKSWNWNYKEYQI